MRELFIYWRVDADRTDAALAAVADVQHALTAQHAGLLARLYQRSDDQGRTTLMETYALPSAGIDAGLQATLVDATATALQRWCGGNRHVEAFDRVTPPA